MQFIFDHLSSILIASVVIMAVSTNQFRTQHSGMEAVSAQATKTKTLSFGKWIEEDILSLGANFGTNRYRFEIPSYDAAGNSTEWVFYSDTTGASGDTLRTVTRYRLEQTGTAPVVSPHTEDDTTQALFQLKRDVAIAQVTNNSIPDLSTLSWEQAGASMGTLSRFRIDLLGRMGTIADDPETADYIRVRMSVVPEFLLNPDNYLTEMYWSSTLKVRPYWDPSPDARNPSEGPSTGPGDSDDDVILL